MPHVYPSNMPQASLAVEDSQKLDPTKTPSNQKVPHPRRQRSTSMERLSRSYYPLSTTPTHSPYIKPSTYP
ncbi:hypothetical protein AOQ84DRAFT_353903 [Glonium stellatum]|uniref:Uncharacterized protein n=1 Tax=Glonium stellatum TaxID=574774 RepID=A0A8E2F3E7_9PEZI|nr:hypothetical protein AOQ84DRAFT_353903 [Glonium stellatum]